MNKELCFDTLGNAFNGDDIFNDDDDDDDDDDELPMIYPDIS